MKGKYKAAVALLLLLILLPLTLMLTVAQWLPTLAGLWLPKGTRIAITSGPRLIHGALQLPDLRYLAGDCELAKVQNAALSHPSRWFLHIDTLRLNPDCISQIPASDAPATAPRTLAQWQAMLPRSWISVDTLSLTSWPQYAGALRLDLTPERQRLDFRGNALNLNAVMNGQALTVKQLSIDVLPGQAPVTLAGDITLPLVPGGLPTQGRVSARFHLPQAPRVADAELVWQGNSGQLLIFSPDDAEPLLDAPWTLTANRIAISDSRWRWPYAGFPLSGRLNIYADDWRNGLDNMQLRARLSVLTQGEAGKGNAVLSFGPGRLSLTNSDMPLRVTGEAKLAQMIFYATLPATLHGALSDLKLRFSPGALLRSRGQVIDSLSIDEVRWPLAGVNVTRRGVVGRLQAILRAHENDMGHFTLHLDGRARHFFPDAGLWTWRYWGDGAFTPMQARWDVKGRGEWRDNTIRLLALSTGFNQLRYAGVAVDAPRIDLSVPLIWQRDEKRPTFTGALTLTARNTRFSGAGSLPPATLNVSLSGRDPTQFNWRGALRAGKIGPVRLQGRWDGVRLRGEAWWPKQTLTVFQPMLPADLKLALKSGAMHAQVAFSAAPGQGLEAGGHGVIRGGSAWLPGSQVNGVDFVLPFRYVGGVWRFGTHGPVRLRIDEIRSQTVARNFRASLQGWYPWSEAQPLLLSDVSVDVLGGVIAMRQLRMPQRDAALLRLQNLSSSELITALKPKQFTLSGRINGALPLWFNHPAWIIKNGWLTNPGPLTLRLDKDMVDAIVRDNMAAGAGMNWLRYVEIAHSWTDINLDNLGQLTMKSSLAGTARVEGKSGDIKLNYSHQENVFTLWRSLRFGDNLQSWLEQNMTLPAPCAGRACKEQ
ncbi:MULTISPECIES: YdbH family protein [Tenebrionibacter/Tenebrionicola group]|jgi:hypothetical protein|uniref:YdbH family protein n=2 Tax=Tenebrionibacter/Tenebrionicola group TaxID=2969848 RepID=A0A8K0V7H7_9ENTR|nr:MULTISPECIES: YdbH family protein [Tenebrionibacter/Tenebrionicola group]MBK4715585.1 YdbH family protein [Tenebrionibacter intestinalis]MBV5095828.1 YdbH family protein [Tenebrionicola larvae]